MIKYLYNIFANQNIYWSVNMLEYILDILNFDQYNKGFI